jgi:hypothetical protein
MTVDLATLLPDLATAFRLRWYYCEAEGALGMRSNFGDQLERARAAGGRNRGSKPLGAAQAIEVTDHQLEAAAAVREIEARLRSLPRALRATLEAAFGPGLPAVARRDLSWLGTSTVPASVVLLLAGRRRIARKTLDKMRRDNKPEDKARLEALRLAARLALTQAVLAYQDTRRDRRPRPSKEA